MGARMIKQRIELVKSSARRATERYNWDSRGILDRLRLSISCFRALARIGLFALIASTPAAVYGQRTESYLGSLADVLRSIHQETGFPLAFENRGNVSVAEWRRRGRAELERALDFSP